jgi:hypothetical protein
LETWKVWLAAFVPWTHEEEREDGLREMAAADAAGALTVKLTGIVCGVLLAPVAAMVIVAE